MKRDIWGIKPYESKLQAFNELGICLLGKNMLLTPKYGPWPNRMVKNYEQCFEEL